MLGSQTRCPEFELGQARWRQNWFVFLNVAIPVRLAGNMYRTKADLRSCNPDMSGRLWILSSWMCGWLRVCWIACFTNKRDIQIEYIKIFIIAIIIIIIISYYYYYYPHHPALVGRFSYKIPPDWFRDPEVCYRRGTQRRGKETGVDGEAAGVRVCYLLCCEAWSSLEPFHIPTSPSIN